MMAEAQVPRRAAVPALELAVEGREAGEARGQGDVPDGLVTADEAAGGDLDAVGEQVVAR